MSPLFKKEILPILFLLFSPLMLNAGDTHENNLPTKIRYQIADAHMHYVDFLQNSEGTKKLLEMMKRSGVDHAMINGLAVTKKWDAVDPVQPRYYLSDDSRTYWYSVTDILVAEAVSRLGETDQQKFHPFISGFNPTDRNAIYHIKRMMTMYPDLWEGIGEILTRHDDLTALTYGEQAQANHVALDPVYTFAAEHDMPVTIHSDISSAWVKDPIYLHEMEAAVKKHPKTRFIWAHAGMSRRMNIPALVPELRRLLKTYPNLWIDLSWVVYPNQVAPDNNPSQAWIALVEEFPDKFMIGTDMIGHFGTYKEIITRYYVFLDALSEQTASKVARENFLRVLPQQATSGDR